MPRAKRKQGRKAVSGVAREGVHEIERSQNFTESDRVGAPDRQATETQEGEGNEEKAKAEEAKVLTEDQRPQMSVAEFLAKALLDAPPGMFVSGERLIIDTARKNDKHPAYMVWAVNDAHVMNITGAPELRDLYFYVKVPREFYERHANIADPVQ